MIPTEKMKRMRAFHNDPAIKEKYLDRVKAHADADEIIKGKYWEGGKGCAVGCTIEGDEHSRYETELGIPMTIAYVEDTFFEMMPNKDSMTYPMRFLEAIPVGADLSLVPAQLIVYILEYVLEIKEVKEDIKVTDSIKTIIKLWKDVVRGKVARSAARSAAGKRYGDALIELLKQAPVK